ncbi:Myrrcad domain-containing protein [Mycoplasma feriruminatoris]|uniref:Myrrcad domain-containing protein n=2 Tax=Mycoplasma feriruminatoris TaxID=1179777 RepID=A0ABY8HUH4_9MOLU|nr:Myrrcad domain-containing protein [Mycoplasma feriruminatoris]
MNSMFYNREDFESSEIENWNTSNVVDMGEMFYGAKKFNGNLSKWNVSNVKNMEKMFGNATSFNNGGKPLEWGEKLKKVNNMKGMFKGASSFKHNLNSWVMKTKVDNTDFGLDKTLEPKWFVETSTPTSPKTPIVQPNSSSISPRTDESHDLPMNTNPRNINSEAPIKKEEPMKEPEFSERENEVLKENESSNSNNKAKDLKDKVYKIPTRPNTIIKSNLPNTTVIVGAVLGTFTILGVGASVGYYYRSLLKNSFFKSKDWLKDKISKIRSK